MLALMAGLVIADELSDALGRVEEQDKEIAALRSGQESAATETQGALQAREEKDR